MKGSLTFEYSPKFVPSNLILSYSAINFIYIMNINNIDKIMILTINIMIRESTCLDFLSFVFICISNLRILFLMILLFGIPDGNVAL